MVSGEIQASSLLFEAGVVETWCLYLKLSKWLGLDGRNFVGLCRYRLTELLCRTLDAMQYQFGERILAKLSSINIADEQPSEDSIIQFHGAVFGLILTESQLKGNLERRARLEVIASAYIYFRSKGSPRGMSFW